jgi:hypothetical protein
LWIAGVPVLCLVIYVGMWTCAIRRGYDQNRLTARIRLLSLENESLQAEVRRLQAPGRIFREALSMKMERPADIKFVQIPTASRTPAQQ